MTTRGEPDGTTGDIPITRVQAIDVHGHYDDCTTRRGLLVTLFSSNRAI